MNSRNHTARRVVVTLLVFGALLLLGAISTDESPGVDWPWLQDHAHDFYVTKGILALVAVVLIIIHMQQAWRESMKLGQRLRYLSLFFLSALIASASAEQVQQHAIVNTRNLGGLAGICLVIAAMVVSIREAPPKRP